MKSGNLNFLEPSGLLQACNGTALPCLLDSGLVKNVLRQHLHKLKNYTVTYLSLRSVVPNCMSKEGHEQKEPSFVSVLRVYNESNMIAWCLECSLITFRNLYVSSIIRIIAGDINLLYKHCCVFIYLTVTCNLTKHTHTHTHNSFCTRCVMVQRTPHNVAFYVITYSVSVFCIVMCFRCF